MTLAYGKDTCGEDSISFVAKPGYEGRDFAVFRVTIEGRPVRVAYYIHVTKADRDARDGVPRFCRLEPSWKISSPQLLFENFIAQAPSATGVAGENGTNFPSFYRFGDIAVSFDFLEGQAVGTTTGTGPAAQITLDTNAAGHGWFIDATPSANEEFLPTADPTVWQARAATAAAAAAGKMDLLSVLLHEYGHALGLEHSGAASGFMSAALQPGVRKLPSADEMALMARLVAQLKGHADVPDVSPLTTVAMVAKADAKTENGSKKPWSH